VKYLLILQLNAAVLDKLTDQQRTVVQAGHDEFRRITEEAGELISTQELADPSTSTVVSSRGVRPGPFHASEEFMGGYYLVDVESKDRAIELAELLPDTRIEGLAVEIRPVMFPAGVDY
jgi:hypothetical protein